MLSKFKSGSFFNDIFRNFILLLLVPMITILFIFNHADKTVKMQVQESASQNLNLYYEQMEDIMKDMRATCYTILENSNCKTYALDTMQEYKLEIKLKRKIYEFLHNLIDTRYHDIFIYYGRDNKCVSGKNTALPAERYYEAYYSETGKVGYRDEFLDVIRTDTKQFACHVIRDYLGKEYLCMTIKVQNNKDTKNSYTICVVLAPEYLNDTWPMRDIDTEGIFLSYNSQDNLILNNAPEFHDMGIVTDLLGEDTKSNTWLDNEKYMICRRDSEIIKNKYLYIVPYESFWNELRQLRTYCFVGIAVCLVISIYFAYRSARRTYNPIGNIVEFIHSKEGGTSYASDIILKLKEAHLIVVEGTLYPLLTRLKNDNLLAYEWVESTQGPPRKYYSLTPAGEEFLQGLEDAWMELANTVNHLKRNQNLLS